MDQLPPLPECLRIYPSRLSLEQATRAPMDEALALDGYATFASLWQLFGTSLERRSLSSISAKILLRQVLADGSGPWHGVAHDAWAVDNLHQSLTELRAAGLTGRGLLHKLTSPASRALGDLLQRFEASLERHGCADGIDRQRQAVLEVVQGRLPSRLRLLRQIDVFAGNELLGAELDLLSAFAARQVRVSIHLSYDVQRPGAFAWSEGLAHRIESLGHSLLRISFDGRVGTGPLAPLRRSLYDHSALPTSAAWPLEVRQVAAGPEHCLGIVEQVVAWHAAGVAPSDMAVVSPDVAMLPRLVAALSAAGFKAMARLGPSLWESQVAQLVYAAWMLPERGFRREDWADVWRGLGHALSHGGCQMSPAELGAALDNMARRHVPPAALASALPKTVGVLASELIGFMQNAPAGGSLERMVEALTPWLERAAALHDVDPEALESMHQVISQFAAAVTLSRTPWTRQELGDWLGAAIRGARLRPSGSSGGIAVLTPEQAVGARFKHVLVAGANADVFPRARQADGVLTDNVRAEINRHFGPRLVQYTALSGRGGMSANARDQWLWMELLACARDALVVTVSAAAGEAQPLLSDFVEELLVCSQQAPQPVRASYGAAGIVSTGTAWRRWAADPQRWDVPTSEPWVPSRIHQERERQKSGIVRLPEALRPVLSAHIFTTVHSVSRLDTLGMCGYRHFAQALLGLSSPQTNRLGLDARERGSAAHAALYEVYADIIATGGLTQVRQNPEAAMGRAEAVVREKQEAILAEVQVDPLLRAAALEQAWHTVARQLTLDLGNPTSQLVALEYRFDDRSGAHAPALELTSPEGQAIRIRGSIDRVDEEGEVLTTLDYKSSISRRSPQRHFQLGIYAVVAHARLKPSATTMQAGWRDLKEARRRLADELSGPTGDVLAAVQEGLWQRLDRLLSGNISPDPDSASFCERCDFVHLCRYPKSAAAARASA